MPLSINYAYIVNFDEYTLLKFKALFVFFSFATKHLVITKKVKNDHYFIIQEIVQKKNECDWWMFIFGPIN